MNRNNFINKKFKKNFKQSGRFKKKFNYQKKIEKRKFA